jgi:hypothetical protein
MHLVKLLRRTFLLLAAGALCSASLTASALAGTGTLGHSGRFYTVDGQPSVLLGIDMQELAADPNVDYTAVFDALEANDVHMVRLWIYPAWAPSRYFEPWTYGVCAPGKYDLDTWNQAYWDRLKSVVDAAKAHDIYVELSLFPSNYVDETKDWTSSVVRFAWNTTYNCNGEFVGNSVGTLVPQFWNPDPSSEIHIRQQQLVDKVLATFPYASYQNLTFEIANEFPGRNTQADPVGSNSQLANPDLPAWQNGWIDYIKANNPGRIVSAHAQDFIGTNTNGIENYWDQPNVDILNFHNSYGDGESVAAMFDPIGANEKNKILQDNESTGNEYGTEATTNVSTQRAWAWNINLGYFKWYWDQAQVAPTDPQFVAALQRLRVMADIDREVDWTDLSDEYNADVVQSTAGRYRLLANPDDGRYLYYGWQSTLDRPLEIDLAAGLYLYKWVDPRDGSVAATGFAAGGGVTSIAQPPDDWNTVAGVVLTAVPATTDDCENGGWTKLVTPVFKNQGDCVSYVATSGE